MYSLSSSVSTLPLNAGGTGCGWKQRCIALSSTCSVASTSVLPQTSFSVASNTLQCSQSLTEQLWKHFGVVHTIHAMHQADLDLYPLLPNMAAGMTSPADTHQQLRAPLVASFCWNRSANLETLSSQLQRSTTLLNLFRLR